MPDLVGVAQEMTSDPRKQNADVVVLMSDLSEKANVEIAQKVEGIHVIVGKSISEKEVSPPLNTYHSSGLTAPLDHILPQSVGAGDEHRVPKAGFRINAEHNPA